MKVVQAIKSYQEYHRINSKKNTLKNYASRAGTLIEIVSIIILRHSHLSTTQRYLGKISDIDALKWIENLYG